MKKRPKRVRKVHLRNQKQKGVSNHTINKLRHRRDWDKR